MKLAVRRSLILLAFLLGIQSGGKLLAQSSTAWTVFDVTEYGADPAGTSCSTNPESIQAAIDAAHTAGGGTVYFPPGTYCVDDELLGYSNITLRGASLGGLAGSSSSKVQATSDFGANKAVIRMANRSQTNFGFQLEDLTILVPGAEDGIIGVDFSSVWYGGIRGVAVAGNIQVSPRRVTSANSIGFLFSDMDGASAGDSCYGNVIEGTSVHAMTTAYKFVSSQGSSTLNTLTNFWVSDVMNGIWTHSIGSVGLSFRDGYMSTMLEVSGRKAFKHTSGSPTIQIINVMYEHGGSFFDAPNDYFVSQGFSSPGPQGAHFGGSVIAPRFQPLVSQAPGSYCGSTAACPCRPGTYPPAESLSFWATIPAETSLSAGANQITYYTSVAATSPTPLPDLYFTFHPSRLANVAGQFFQMTGNHTVTTPFSYDFQTYNVTLTLSSAVTLTADFIFFLEAETSVPSTTPGSCLYPPTL